MKNLRFGERKSPPRSNVWFDEEIGVLQILLSKEDIGLSDEDIELSGKVFQSKKEVHITIIGRDLGQRLKQAMGKDDSIKNHLREIISRTDWTYEVKSRLYYLSKDKRVDTEPGIIHAESIIVEVDLAGIRRFYENLSKMLRTDLDVPPTHITLYTRGDPLGIALNSRADFEQFVIGKVVPGELKTKFSG